MWIIKQRTYKRKDLTNYNNNKIYKKKTRTEVIQWVNNNFRSLSPKNIHFKFVSSVLSLYKIVLFFGERLMIHRFVNTKKNCNFLKMKLKIKIEVTKVKSQSKQTNKNFFCLKLVFKTFFVFFSLFFSLKSRSVVQLTIKCIWCGWLLEGIEIQKIFINSLSFPIVCVC